MKRYIHILLLLLLACLVSQTVQAQSKAEISDIDFYQEGNNLIITYDIRNYKSNEIFVIWVEIYKITGERVRATKYSGDYGIGVKGGSNKRIVWDMQADDAELDSEIYVEVFARVNRSNEKDVEPEVTEIQEKTVAVKEEKTPTIRKVSAGKAILFSVLLPGLGTTYAKRKGANWLWGIAGYGCIAGAVVMNNAAYNSLDEYATETDIDERNKLYDQAKNQDLFSKVFVAGAAAIWIGNIISSGVKAGKVNREYRKSHVHLLMDYDRISGYNRIGIAYRF